MHTPRRDAAAKWLIPFSAPALAALSLVLLPPIAFYWMLSRSLLDLPIEDDYEVMLNFTDSMVQLHTFSAKMQLFFATQHNEYKLFFDQAITLLQFAILGKLDFRILCVIGNVFVLCIGILLWKFFLPQEHNLTRRLLLFFPVSCLLFQLQYIATLNWAMGSLQNLPVVFFSLLALCLARTRLASFVLALISMAMAIGSSANGLLLIPIGAALFLLDRRYPRLLAWLAASALCLAAYFYRYQIAPPVPRHSVSLILLRMPVFFLSFLGSAAGHPFRVVAIVAGAGLILFLIFLFFRGYPRANPVVTSWMLFILLTAGLTTLGRTEYGVMGSLASRYSIYSNLLIILVWFAVVEVFLTTKPHRLSSRPVVPLLVSCVACLFAVASDISGYKALKIRNQDLLTGMSLYEHTSHTQGPTLLQPGFEALYTALNVRGRVLLKEAADLGVYQPPPL